MTTMTAASATETLLQGDKQITIPCPKAEHSDPTSYHCYELQGLCGTEKIYAAAKIASDLEDFEFALSADAIDGGWGTLTFEVPVENSPFWQFCAENELTLKDLNEGISFMTGTVSFPYGDIFAYLEPEEWQFTEEQMEDIEKLIADRPERFFIQADGTVKYVA